MRNLTTLSPAWKGDIEVATCLFGSCNKRHKTLPLTSIVFTILLFDIEPKKMCTDMQELEGAPFGILAAWQMLSKMNP